jgi:hypothetical protein
MSKANLFHYANIEDESTGEAFEEFHFDTVGGRRESIVIERDRADQAKEVRLQLRKFNADLPPDVNRSLREVEGAVNAPPARYLVHSARTGWRQNNTAFVTPWRTIDSKKRSRTILPPRRINDAQRCGGRPKGDLGSWKKYVAHPCGFADLGMTMLAAAFTAPLLKIADRQSFGLHVHSASKRGKSTMLLAASSVGGVGREEEMPNWSATSAAIGELCRLHCDRLMPINEAGLLAKKKTYAKMQSTIYQIAESRERDRHSKSGFATTDDSACFRIIFISNAEHTIDYYARLAEDGRDEGEIARCTEIPAVRRDRSTVIDRFPDDLPNDQRAAWARKLLNRIRTACKSHHGVALPPVIRFVMKDPARAKRLVASYMKEFMDGLDVRKMSGAVQHAAGNCSLIYAGGCIAVDAGVLDYDKRDLRRAIEQCFREALHTAVEERDPLLRAKRVLRQRLNSDRVFQMRSSRSSFVARSFDGYAAKDGEKMRYVIRARSMREWFKNEPGAFRGIIEWLARRGCLQPRQSRSARAEQQPTDWAERNLAWPDKRKTVTRSVIFDYPFAK